MECLKFRFINKLIDSRISGNGQLNLVITNLRLFKLDQALYNNN